MSPYDPECVAGPLNARTSADGGLGTDHDIGGGLIPEETHTLRGEGFDASEDGTGRGTPLVPDYCGALNDGAHMGGGGSTGRTPIPDESSLPPVAWALQERDHKGSDSDTKEGHLIPVRSAFDDEQEVSPTLTAPDPAAKKVDGKRQDGSRQDRTPIVPVAFEPRYARNGRGAPDEVVPPLKAQSGRTGKGDGAACVATNLRVRRLTPRECERLQGFPDDYTRISWKGKPAEECPDGHRYKALGNSWAVHCARWLGERIELVEKIKSEQSS